MYWDCIGLDVESNFVGWPLAFYEATMTVYKYKVTTCRRVVFFFSCVLAVGFKFIKFGEPTPTGCGP